MDWDDFDTLVWWSLRFLNFVSVYFGTVYWKIPIAWGKFYGEETFHWTNYADSKTGDMNFGVFTILMEIPTFIWTFLIFPYGQHAANYKAWILMAPYTLHYLHRAFVYPYLTGQEGIQKIYTWFIYPGEFVSFTIAASNTRLISHHIDYDNDTWFWYRVFLGGAMYVYGYYIRVKADHIMTGLKRKHGKYVLLRGWWFDLIDCPNFLGELMVWYGWTVMTGSVVTLNYAFYVSTLLYCRAYHTHKFYIEKFEDYPKSRKRLIPYVW